MEITQVYNLTNTIYTEITGKSGIVAEDLSNVVDIGKEIFGATSVDKYTGSLIDHIGRMVFVDRPYKGIAPSVVMDAWEYGAVLEKVQMDTPTASENASWGLTDKQSYDPNIFYKPVISAKFFNQRTTFEVDMSITDIQVKSAFDNATQLNAFYSMIYTAIERAITARTDALVLRAINNMSAQTLNSEYPDKQYTTKSGVRAVNLLKLYNDEFSASLTPAQAVTNPEFTRYAVFTMLNYIDRLKSLSTLFNVGGKERFTSPEYLTTVMLSSFKNAADVYLQSTTFNERYTALPNADTVPYWQGSGTDYSFDSVSKIHVNIKDGEGTTEEITAGGILAVMFDRWALGVSNFNRRITTNYNPKGEFTNNFYKQDAGYFNDLNENFVVFFVA